MIAEFASPVDAIIAAVEFQKSIIARNAACAEEDRAGGAGLSHVRRVPNGVRIVTHFDEAVTALTRIAFFFIKI